MCFQPPADIKIDQDGFADRLSDAEIRAKHFLRRLKLITGPYEERHVREFFEAWNELKSDVEDYRP